MITGYNIDVQYEGVTYHVQTEDMGIDLKRIITHVFIGGAILCSKKTDYSRHLIHGYDEKKIKELMDEQHRTVVRIIQAGKLDVLRRKIEESDEPDREMFPVLPPSPPKPAPSPVGGAVAGPGVDYAPVAPEKLAAQADAFPPSPEERRVAAQAGAAPPHAEEVELTVERTEAPQRNTLGSLLNRIIQRAGAPRKLKIDVVAGTEIVSGQPSVMRIFTREAESGKPVPDCKVTIKVIGMTFRPVIHTGHTDGEGVFTLNIVIPDFTTGQAAVIVQAQSEFGSDELKLKVTRKG